MTKLLEHTNGTRKDLINSLATAEQSIQQLQVLTVQYSSEF